MKKLIKSLLPYGLVTAVQKRSRESRRGRWTSMEESKSSEPDREKFSYSAAIEFLVSRGAPRDQVLAGSMPEASLKLASKILNDHLPPSPVLGIHIGNFLGVSLAALTDAARSIHRESLVISIDPNIPHRGISSPQHEVMALIDKFQLTNHVLCIAGYSLNKSVSNDGLNYTETYDPIGAFNSEYSCENALAHLTKWHSGSVDFILIDGNHDELYLARELEQCSRLLNSGGILILDDVSHGWEGVMQQFDNLGDTYEKVVADGRIGIARKLSKGSRATPASV